jgi:hypothetical protein
MEMRVDHWWTDTDRGKPKYSEKKPVPLLLCSTQISRGLAWDRTRVSGVRDLTA